MKSVLRSMLLAFCFILPTYAADKDNTKVFELLNLDYPGLEQVKELYNAGKELQALEALLSYYRTKEGTLHPDFDLSKTTLSKAEQRWADEALEHKFFVHRAYQPSYFYGKEIDWNFWPIKDNELRWQLHRLKWWIPMGKAYQNTKDEKYVKEWMYQYNDWLQKNPLDLDKFHNNDPDKHVDQMDNVLFAWRPLEASHRLNDHTILYLLFIQSPNFTPEFLANYLVNVDTHANHVVNHYSKEGNHLLFEAQRVLYAGACFPELKDASAWRQSGVDILLEEMKKQVFEDGVQYELDPSYHLASINIFAKAGYIAKSMGFGDEFPAWYFETIRKMIDVTFDTTFPDYIYPLFSDSRETTKRVMLENYREFLKLFPNDQAILYFATEGKEGVKPTHLSTGYFKGGFYVFRNGWSLDAIQMVVKAGGPAFWHNQPDNGTFELYVRGRNFFPDSGRFVYGGDEEVLKQRAWFKQTRVHNTLTLDNQNLEHTDSKTLLWKTDAPVEVLVTENQSYADLKHRRSVFFVEGAFFVLVDEAIGAATGSVGIHYNMAQGEVSLDKKELQAVTQFNDDNNLQLKVIAPKGAALVEEEGWTSPQIREKYKRTTFAVNVDKKDGKTIRYVTILLPITNSKEVQKIAAKVAKSSNDEQLSLKVKIGKSTYKLGYQL